MALNGGAERPEVHAVGADADGAAAAAGAEGQDLVEAVEQAGPLLALDEPFELRAVGGELRGGEPVGEVPLGVVDERGVGGEGAKGGGGAG